EPCSCCCLRTRVTTCYITTNLYHSICVTCITCSRCSEAWRGCTLDRCICSCSSDHWCLCIYLCDRLRSCHRRITTCINCSPGSCCCLRTRVTTCYITTNLYHSVCVTCITCSWCREAWCSCTLDRCICSCSSDHWCLCIYLCYCLAACCTRVTTCIYCE